MQIDQKPQQIKTELAGNEVINKINEALEMNVPRFKVDLQTGNLLYNGGRFIFDVTNGNLEWGVAI